MGGKLFLTLHNYIILVQGQMFPKGPNCDVAKQDPTCLLSLKWKTAHLDKGQVYFIGFQGWQLNRRSSTIRSVLLNRTDWLIFTVLTVQIFWDAHIRFG